jgi:hypothetical protein
MKTMTNPLTFPVPLTRLAHQVAQQFSQQHSHAHKAKQIYLNTLAIYAVNYYLECFGIETNLEASNSWNSVLQTLTNVADLEIKERGKLECCPLLPNDEFCQISIDALPERIGYVAVRLNRELTEATLLGFVDRVNSQTLSLNQLNPLEDLVGYLDRVRPFIYLSQWFEGVFESGWQTLETFLNQQPEYVAVGIRTDDRTGDRPTIKATKLIDLGMQLGENSIVLLIATSADEENNFSIKVQVQTSPGERYLPPDLKLSLLSETGEVIREVSSRSLDNVIQLPLFKCRSGESFGLQLTLDRFCWVENFRV